MTKKISFCLGILLTLTIFRALPASALEILAAGDVTLAWRIYHWPPSSLFSEAARKRIGMASLFVWNCETSGTSSVSKEKNDFCFHADGRFFDQMRFENGMAVTANNHVFDGYQEGAGNLLRILSENGIRHNGVHVRGQYRPVRIDGPVGQRISFIAGSPMSQTGSGPSLVTLNYPQLLETTRVLRQEDEKTLVVVSVHDGLEHDPMPTPQQKQWAFLLALAGADVVLFSHSHVYGPFEVLKNTPRRTFVAWGLGNFLFGGNFDWKTRQDVRMLSIRINPANGDKEGRWIFGRTTEWKFSLLVEPMPESEIKMMTSASPYPAQ